MTEMVRAIMESVATLVGDAWADFAAVDETLSQIAESFDGEEPLHPDLRELLDETRAVLLEIHQELARDGLSLDLPAAPAERTRDALMRSSPGRQSANRDSTQSGNGVERPQHQGEVRTRPAATPGLSSDRRSRGTSKALSMGVV